MAQPLDIADDPEQRSSAGAPLPDFARHLEKLAPTGHRQLRRGAPTTLQLNIGKRCNLACHHCHVESGPKRQEAMDRRGAERILALLSASPGIELLDLTGGAPELNPHFRFLVEGARALGRRVMNRCNLTVFFEPGQEDTPEFLARKGVEIVASLPCYTADNVEKQRGRGVFGLSIEALRRLNALGYAAPGTGLELHLVYNPVGAFLPPDQAALEADYRDRLRADFGIVFDRLFTLANMPIKRFAHDLRRDGEYEAYMSLLVDHFNPQTLPALMCRELVSVGYDGRLFDCDFNQQLEIPLAGRPRTIWDVDDLTGFEGEPVETASHCFGCTAGAGSSCAGSLAGDAR
ncbi:MAG: arsenosugar biosynthesis radical SAM protein ArsS [Deltaproteobacteria bacterium]|nr:arsenosugar biosynthesis radical SAM protein ArsS [Deltaproteobacteria bacterium]MBW2417078.1 arsenosugar biosynthesis radical SAM protein ArsS [Deltaproteobacteria bacterium]